MQTLEKLMTFFRLIYNRHKPKITAKKRIRYVVPL